MPTNEFRSSFQDTIETLHVFICESISTNDDSFYQLLRNYYSFVRERTEALFLLVQHDCLWDAEIILRPIAECTVKFGYISSFDETMRIEKVREFWEDLAEINKLKRSNQAKQVIGLTNIDSTFLIDVILNDTDQTILTEKWTKQLRQRKEQPWSYNEMIKSISENYEFKEILGLARNFTQSSHFIHADETALGVIADRKNRTTEQKEALMNLHEVRLLSDCVSLYFWIAQVSSKLCGEKITTEVLEKMNQFNNFESIFNPLKKLIE